MVYDPSKVTFGQLLKVFFSVAHDPTELNRQGPDTGTQYRSAIFFETPDQERIAKAYVSQLTDAKIYSGMPMGARAGYRSSPAMAPFRDVHPIAIT